MINHIENYLLNTGKWRAYFKYYFLLKYWVPMQLLMQYYSLWVVIEEGFHPHDTFRIFLKTYNWQFNYYAKITQVCFYLKKLEIVPITNKESSVGFRFAQSACFIRKCKQKTSFITLIIDRITHRKEAAHA